MNKLIRAIIIPVMLIMFSQVYAIQDGRIAPPDVEVVDKNGVNVATGQVVSSLNTVAIGGDRGLSHSVSNFTNEFSFQGWYGYHDNYSGSARYEEVGRNIQYGGATYPIFKVMRVSGPMGSEDFKVMVSGVFNANAHNVSSNYTYQALGDKRNSLALESSGQYLVWRKPDGTELKYARSGSSAASGGPLREVIQPNGMTYYISSLGGVTTNTGYALKYHYVNDTRDLSSEKKAIRSSIHPDAQISQVASSTWSGRNPKYVYGVNLAVDDCQTQTTANCSFSNSWPKAEFEWPGGMPQAIFLGSSIFKVTDSGGQATEYHFESQDVMIKDGSYVGPYPWAEKQKWSPRLKRIKGPASSNYVREYEYENVFTSESIVTGGGGIKTSFDFWRLDTSVGRVSQSETQFGESQYSQQLPPGRMINQSSSYTGTLKVEPSIMIPGSLITVTNPKTGTYYYESSFRNFITRHDPISGAGPEREFQYDNRGNLEKVIYPDSEVVAKYPSSCTASNRKYCNKPEWVKDQRGNVTNFTYHSGSGEVSTVTYPADRLGVRAKVRYEYKQYYAYYKKSGSSVAKADRPLWLLWKESRCKLSSTTSSGCSMGASDEVVTEYDYGPQDGTANNLHLKSVTVTSDGESRITCYQYDQYGNRIGEISPNGVSTSCPQGV